MTFCTIVAGNYIPQARVLASSVARFHPGSRMYVLVIDDPEPASEPGLFEAVGPDDIGIDRPELHRMAGIYDVMELATALKPWLLATLLGSGDGDGPAVAYIDPDIELYAALDELPGLCRDSGIVLTPHVLTPIPMDDLTPSEAFILAAGVYNLGFIAVSRAALGFLTAWEERLRRNCIVDPEAMIFVDQRWIDFAPALCSPAIWKDRGANVAYWNVHERDLRHDAAAGAWTVAGGAPLRFFHFSGYDPDKPWRLSKHQGERPRHALLLSEQPALRTLCEGYRARLRASGYGTSGDRYGWGTLANGFMMDRHARHAYRRGLIASEEAPRQADGPGGAGPGGAGPDGASPGGAGPDGAPPGPFDDADGFVEWLAAPEPGTMRPAAIGRYLTELARARGDLIEAFGDPRNLAFEEPFLAWLHAHGQHEEHIDSRLVPPRGGAAAGPVWPLPQSLRRGATVVGHVRAEAGTGELARLAVRVLEAAGEEATVLDHGKTSSRALHPFERVSTPPATVAGGYDVNLVCLNADILPGVAAHLGEGLFAGRYTIGYWAWELEELPPSMRSAFAAVDEVWGISDFTARALRRYTTKPVVAMPLPVAVPAVPPDIDRAALGLPAAFCFLFCFDLLSVFERKNPLGLLDAFTRAFRPGEGPVLVIKAVNGALRAIELERLRLAAAERPDVLVIDRYLSAAENAALIGTCDCYVSLHRSEGFGLTLAEAMALGRPVVATGYSGNLDFMDNESSFLVPYELAEVPPGCEPYPAGARWAGPDLDAAAHHLRTVYERPDLAGRRAGVGKARVLAHHGLEDRARLVRARLARIRSGRVPAHDGLRRALPRANLELRRLLRL